MNAATLVALVRDVANGSRDFSDVLDMVYPVLASSDSLDHVVPEMTNLIVELEQESLEHDQFIHL